MTTTRPALAVTHRDVTGKAVARLRRAGHLPAVVFGHGVPSANVTVDVHAFESLRRHSGPNTLIDLSVDGKKARPVLVHGVQFHPVTRRPLHVDLLVVRMTEELTVDVPLVGVGVSPTVDLHGGTVVHGVEHIRARALPDHLPQAIEFDLSSIVDFETIIHVRDLPIPPGVTLVSDPDDVVARALPPRIEIEEVAPAPEVPEEGAAPAAEEATEAAAPSEV